MKWCTDPYWGLDMSCVFEPGFRLQTLPHVGLIEHVGETSKITAHKPIFLDQDHG